jgi:hypothetical protein
MHFGHGIGMLSGIRRGDVPVAALAAISGLGGVARRFAPVPDPVFAPSLDAG